MSDISINKTTGISIGLLIVLVPAFTLAISLWTRVQAQVERNTADIATILERIDNLNANLIETNGNIIKLNTRLDSLSAQQTAPAVHVAPSQPTRVIVMASEDSEPTSQPTPSEAAPSEPAPSEPPSQSPPQAPPQPTIFERLQDAVCIPLGQLCRGG